MRIINYHFNWNNKLMCDCWSTIRLANSNKYQLLEVYEHRLVKKDDKFSFFRYAKLMYLKEISIEEISDPMALMDCALTWRACVKLIKTMYKNKDINWKTQKLYFMVFSSKSIY